MKSFITALLAAMVALAVPVAPAATKKGISVYDLGKDGDIRYYKIRCQDDRELILEGDYEKKQTCFPLNSGEQSCLKMLDIRRAGERACAATVQ
jgi:hypothetical protein